MVNIYVVAAFWLLAALVSTIIANRLKISMALMEIIIVGVVIASAIIPTLIANKFFLPDHLLEKPVLDDQLPDILNGKKKALEF
jgi:hypothetical protein